jgi:hypothetical protein
MVVRSPHYWLLQQLGYQESCPPPLGGLAVVAVPSAQIVRLVSLGRRLSNNHALTVLVASTASCLAILPVQASYRVQIVEASHARQSVFLFTCSARQVTSISTAKPVPHSIYG